MGVSRVSRQIVKLGSSWVVLQDAANALEEVGAPNEIVEKVRKAMKLIDEASDELEPFQ
jgi:hypothetical protein